MESSVTSDITWKCRTNNNWLVTVKVLNSYEQIIIIQVYKEEPRWHSRSRNRI